MPHPAEHADRGTASSSSATLLTPSLSPARQQTLKHVAAQYKASRSKRTATDGPDPEAIEDTDATVHAITSDSARTPREGAPEKLSEEHLHAAAPTDAEREHASDGSDITHSPTTSAASASPFSQLRASKIHKGAAPVSSKRRAAAQRKAEEAAQAGKAELRRAVQLARAQEQQRTASTTPMKNVDSSRDITEHGEGTSDATPRTSDYHDSVGTPTTSVSAAAAAAAVASTSMMPSGSHSPPPFMPGPVDEYHRRHQQQHRPCDGQSDCYGPRSDHYHVYDGAGDSDAVPHRSPLTPYGTQPSFDNGPGYHDNYMPPRETSSTYVVGALPYPPAPPPPRVSPHVYNTNSFSGVQQYLQQRTDARHHRGMPMTQPPPLQPPPPPPPPLAAPAMPPGGRLAFSVRVPEGAGQHSSSANSPLLQPPPAYTEPRWSPPSGVPRAPAAARQPPPYSTAAQAPRGGTPGATRQVPSPTHVAPSRAQSKSSTAPPPTRADDTGTKPSGSTKKPGTRAVPSTASRTTAGSSRDETTAESVPPAEDSREKEKVGKPCIPPASCDGNDDRSFSGLLSTMRLEQRWTISCSRNATLPDKAGFSTSPAPAPMNSSTLTEEEEPVVFMESDYLVQLLPTWSLLTSGLIYEPAHGEPSQDDAKRLSDGSKEPTSAATAPAPSRLRQSAALGVFPAHLSEVMATEQALANATASFPNSPTATASLASSTSVGPAPRYYCAEVELDLLLHLSSHNGESSAGNHESHAVTALRRSQRLLRALRQLEQGSLGTADLAAMLNDAMLTILRVAPRFDSLCDALALASLPPLTPSPMHEPSDTTLHGGVAAAALTRELLDVIGVTAVPQTAATTSHSAGGGNVSYTSSASCAVTPQAGELSAQSQAGPQEEQPGAAPSREMHFHVPLPQHVPYVSSTGAPSAAINTITTTTAAGTTLSSGDKSPQTSYRALLSSLVVAAGGPESSATAVQPVGLQVDVVRTATVAEQDARKDVAPQARATLLVSVALRDDRPASVTTGPTDTDIWEALTTVFPAPLLFSSHTRRVSSRPFGNDCTGAASTVSDGGESAEAHDAVEVSQEVLAKWVTLAWGHPVSTQASADNVPLQTTEEAVAESDYSEGRDAVDETTTHTVSGHTHPQRQSTPEAAEVTPRARLPDAARETATPAEPHQATDKDPAETPAVTGPAALASQASTEAATPTPDSTRDIYINTMAAPLADLLHTLYTSLRECRAAAIRASQEHGVTPLETMSADFDSRCASLARRTRCTVPEALLRVLQPGRTKKTAGTGRSRQRGKSSANASAATTTGGDEDETEDLSEAHLTELFTNAAAAADAVLYQCLSAHRHDARPRRAPGEDLPDDDAAAALTRWLAVTTPDTSLLQWLASYALRIVTDMEAALVADAVHVAVTPLPASTASLGAPTTAPAHTGAPTGRAPRAVVGATEKRAHRRGGNQSDATAPPHTRAGADGVLGADTMTTLSQSTLHPLRYLYDLLIFAEQDPLTVEESWLASLSTATPAAAALSAASSVDTVIPYPPPAATLAGAYCLRFHQTDTNAEGRVRHTLRHAATQLQALISELQCLKASLTDSSSSATHVSLAALWEDDLVPHLNAVAQTLAKERESRGQLKGDAQRSARAAATRQAQREVQLAEEAAQPDRSDESHGGDAGPDPDHQEPQADSRHLPAPVVAPLQLSSRDLADGTGVCRDLRDIEPMANDRDVDEEEEGDGESASLPVSTPRHAPSSQPSARRPKPSTPRTAKAGARKPKKNSQAATRNDGSAPSKMHSASQDHQEKPRPAAAQSGVPHSDAALLRHLLLPFLGVALVTALFLYFA